MNQTLPILHRLLCWLILTVSISEADEVNSRIRFSHHNQEGGLLSDQINDILQDKSGWVWMATDRGLNGYDAYVTRSFRHSPDNNTTLSSDDLTCLTLGPDESVWVGTAGAGINRFDRNTSSFERIVPGQHVEGKIDARNLPAGVVSDLAVSEDLYLWIGTDQGLFVMNMMTRKVRGFGGGGPAGERISCIAVFDKKDVWIGTEKGELYKWVKDSEFKLVLRKPAPITAIARDTRLQLWIGTAGSGLSRMPEEGKDIPVDLEIRDITSLWSDTNGDLWIGTTQGLAKKVRGENQFKVYRSVKGEPQSLCHNHVTMVFEDHARLLWVATKGGGTSRFHLDQYLFPHTKNNEEGFNMPHASIWSMAATAKRDKVWMGTELGVFRWLIESQKVESGVPGLEEMGMIYAVSLLEDSKGNLWVGTKGEGLFKRLPNGVIKHYLHDPNNLRSLGHNFVNALFEDAKGRIWIGTYGAGVQEYIPLRDEFEKQVFNGEKLHYVNRFGEDAKGRIWAGGREGLFLTSDPKSGWHDFTKVIKGRKPGETVEITAMWHEGILAWIGTKRHGITRVNIITGESSWYSTKRDLAANEIVSIASDSNGFIWIATESGITRYNMVKDFFRNFTEEDGLQSGEYRKNAFAQAIHPRTKEPILLFGGAEGFNSINPQDYPPIPQAPQPILTTFEYFGKEVTPGPNEVLKKPLASTMVLPIPYDFRNRFAIRFASTDRRFPYRGFFRYQLEGVDLDWQLADKDRRASYGNLPVGSYTFKVQSSTDGEKWTPRTASVVLKITPSWWQTWYFRGAVAVVVLGGAFLGFRKTIQSRIRAIQRQEAKASAARDKAEIALARQLQQGVMLERTSRGFLRTEREEEIFNEPLRSLVEHFHVKHGSIYRIVSKDKKETVGLDLDGSIKMVAQYSTGGTPNLHSLPLNFHDESIQSALRSETAFAVPTPPEIQQYIGNFDPNASIKSVLFIGTRYLNRPNGVIVLLSEREPENWHKEDIQLVGALSPQFGMCIAQMKLAEQEKEYLEYLENSRHQAEVANRAKSDFLAKMTHELRTPLNSIIGFTEMFLGDKTLNQQQRSLIKIVNSSGDHLLDVINDILDLSKIEAGKIEICRETFEFVPLLKSVYDMLGMKAREKGIKFEFKTQTPLPGMVHTDRSKIRQTLINLIGNAIKFTDEGQVTMTVGATSVGEPIEEDGKMKRRVRIGFEVADTGKGIAEEDIDKLFEKYGQTESGMRSSEGTGLGLPIARSFIQLMGGDIFVESEYGKGTKFKFYIECDEVAGPQEESSATLSEISARHINGIITNDSEDVRILIAEDQPNNRLLLRSILNRAGFEMREAVNGQEAVDVCDEWHPHLIFMDEDMPILKGSEAARQINERNYEDSPVIVSLTAYAIEQAKQKALKAGCDDFVAKPFKAHEIFSVISRHLDVEYTFTNNSE